MADHEEFDGLCEECHEKEASCTVAVMIGGQVTHRHLCGDCLAKMNATIAAGGVKHLISTIMAALTGPAGEGEKAAPAPEEEILCPQCRMAFSTVRKTGRVGCAGCYRAFEKQLIPALESAHGSAQHEGRRPLRSENEQNRRARCDELTRQMEQAVAIEDYETAALLRDQRNALMQKEDA